VGNMGKGLTNLKEGPLEKWWGGGCQRIGEIQRHVGEGLGG